MRFLFPLVAVVLVAATMFPTPKGGVYAQQVMSGGWLAAAAMLGFALASQNALARTTWALTRLRRGLLSIPAAAFSAGLFVVGVAAYSACTWLVFDAVPHIEDSHGYLFQGQILAHGKMHLAAPPVPDAFFLTHVVIKDGRWYTQYPPGHPMLLMLGVLVKLPWLVSPLAGAATLVFCVRIGRNLGGELAGRLAGVLCLLSPFVFFMSGEFMAHSTSMFLFAWFADRWVHAEGKLSYWRGADAGLPLALNALNRPLTAIGLCLPFGLVVLWDVIRRRPGALAYALGFVPPLALGVGFLLLYNKGTTGDAFTTGYQALWGNRVLPGTGAAPWGEPHSLAKGVENTFNNFNLYNRFLFEWPVPSLLFPLVALLPARRTRNDILLGASIFGLGAAYVTYWYQDYCLGPRFLYESSASAAILAAMGFVRAPELLARQPGRHRRGANVLLASVLLVCVAYMGVVRMPELWRHFSTSYWGVDRKLRDEIVKTVPANSLVLLTSKLEKAFLLMDTSLDGKWVIARDIGFRNTEVMKAFPNREVWLEREGKLTKYERPPLPAVLPLVRPGP